VVGHQAPHAVGLLGLEEQLEGIATGEEPGVPELGDEGGALLALAPGQDADVGLERTDACAGLADALLCPPRVPGELRDGEIAALELRGEGLEIAAAGGEPAVQAGQIGLDLLEARPCRGRILGGLARARDPDCEQGQQDDGTAAQRARIPEGLLQERISARAWPVIASG
jgi:hypothetical protein